MSESNKEISSLFWAIEMGDSPTVRKLLMWGSNAKSADSDGNTALHHVFMGFNNNVRLSIISALLKFGADPNAQNKQGSTPLHFAIEHGNKNALKSLIVAGADTKIKDGAGLTPMDYSVDIADPEIFAILNYAFK